MAVPKKRTSISKKIIRKNFWKKRGYWTTLKAFSLAQSIFTGNSKSFFCNKYKRQNNLN
uniref:Large ribosomal subunit protein bL32c n=3 Tax=indigoferoid/millettioid clade TaxID=2233855 RepID=A0A6H0EP86_ABRPR|nr:ribosomal protein L32 [Abrus precatorius]QIT03166.1 ribosomal protein L32 [Abrus precatorius]QJW34039.1 ribosomal protein L32 [Abrus pulchellus subsp. cantoniensis]BDI24326.1 ribosomal protein L32 [Abrus pulchellus subsp. mollis]